MKKLIYLLFVLPFVACSNQEVELPDFKYNAVYFPLQYPVRTLILGDDRVDNSLDKQLKFHIGASIGGMYKNTRDWNVDYVVDPSLVNSIKNSKGDVIEVLPESYYQIAPKNRIVIPAGSFDGLAEVQLTEAFLNDPKAIIGSYVIPLRITASDADSILVGKPLFASADKNVAGHWDPNAKPKDFVLFGIKFINPYHGSYFHRGKDVTYDSSNKVVKEEVYRQKYIENNQIWKLTTTGRYECVTNGVGSNVGAQYAMKLSLNAANGDIVVSEVSSSKFKTNGTGKFVAKGGEWGGQKFNAIYLNYSYIDGANNHVVNDTLVFRNNGVVFEENVIVKF